MKKSRKLNENRNGSPPLYYSAPPPPGHIPHTNAPRRRSSAQTATKPCPPSRLKPPPSPRPTLLTPPPLHPLSQSPRLTQEPGPYNPLLAKAVSVIKKSLVYNQAPTVSVPKDWHRLASPGIPPPLAQRPQISVTCSARATWGQSDRPGPVYSSWV